jgi:2-polyprenyl-6-methoxyphenol hydroxylase-like FAD-dependent oxidoreductase
MAMEDAVVLAECLATAASVKVGLEAFMKRRFERVRQVVDSSAAISKLEQEGASPSTIYARRYAAIRQLAEPY